LIVSTGTYNELSDPDEALSKATFEDLGPVDVLLGRFFALLEVDVLGHDISNEVSAEGDVVSRQVAGLLR
jgi:hypothetical protein